jgi:hypothetical protein
MRQGRLQARLDKLILSTHKVGKIAMIFPDDWSAEAQTAYDAASGAGDTARMAAIILQETGEQVSFDDGSVIKVIEVRTLHYGPGGV